MSDYTLGQPVLFTRTLTRRYQPAAPRSKRIWDPVAYPGAPIPAKRRGIIVGVRTLSHGECDDGYYDIPTVYYPTDSFTAYLVAYDLRRKPVLVLPAHLEPTGGAS